MSTHDPDLAKAVAKQLERRARRRKLAMYGALAGAIALAIVYGTCGHGWGFGAGKGDGKGDGDGKALVTAPTTDAGPARCAIRVTAAGITVDGATLDRAAAVTACSRTKKADVVVTGDARQGDWDELRAALVAAGVEISTKN